MANGTIPSPRGGPKKHQLFRDIPLVCHELWSELTDDGLDVIAGKRDILVSKIEERSRMTREQADRLVQRAERGVWLRSNMVLWGFARSPWLRYFSWWRCRHSLLPGRPKNGSRPEP
jgi:uncharacterized protein YjbJ (UPF0337 family)